jgi:hypothetical protein
VDVGVKVGVNVNVKIGFGVAVTVVTAVVVGAEHPVTITRITNKTLHFFFI